MQHDAEYGRVPMVWLVRSKVEAAVLYTLAPFAERLEQAAQAALRAPRPRSAVPSVVSPHARAKASEREATDGLARLAQVVASGTMSEDEVRAEARRLRALRAEALRVLAAAPDSSAGRVPAARVRALREQWGDLPTAARRVIVSELVERVIVHADKSMDVVPR